MSHTIPDTADDYTRDQAPSRQSWGTSGAEQSTSTAQTETLPDLAQDVEALNEVEDTDEPASEELEVTARPGSRRKARKTTDAATTRIRRNAARAALTARDALSEADEDVIALLQSVLSAKDSTLNELAVALATTDGADTAALGFLADLRTAGSELERVLAVDAADEETVKAAWRFLAERKLVSKNRPESDIKAATAISAAVEKLGEAIDSAAAILSEV
ncbi:hypothetical protein [Nesterenkonia rhizosphaerae]|uniref:Uncharacterized protein n=1 Tax=Nesterenkonia rhizosphaerae TaxID=1348272 RepID=A0ABP9G1H5_9MICC